MWGNATYGDCCSAEEAFCKACHTPELFIPDAEVEGWASHHGFLNGATLVDVLDTMQTHGFPVAHYTYNDGVHTAVDWTSRATLMNAIAHGPVKLGVAADQLETAVPDPPKNGWFGSGFSEDNNLDHCVSGAGYGSVAWLLSQLGGTVPTGVNGTEPGIAIFTWSSIGVLDWNSFLAITGECWLRNPSTVIVPK